MLKLYYTPGSCALATHIALIEAGADYELAYVSFKSAEQTKPEYLKVNPKARVPALVTERGVLTETPALLVYVAQKFPAKNLALIDDPYAFAEVQAFNSYLCATVHMDHAHRMRGYRWVDANDEHSIKAMQKNVPVSVNRGFSLIERDFLKGPYVMGDRFTICDAYLFTLSQYLEADGADLSKLPRVLEFRERLRERPSVKRALEEEAKKPAAAA
jgi:glutathione S-transferase